MRGTKHIVLFVIASLSLIPISLLSLIGGIPPAPDYAPSSLLVSFFIMIMPVHFMGYVMPSLLFVLWNWYVFKGRNTVPLRTTIAFFLLLVSNGWFISTTWSYSISYHGIPWTHWIGKNNAIAMVVLIACWISAIKLKTSAANLVFSWVLFAWLCWCAFPWMGEYM